MKHGLFLVLVLTAALAGGLHAAQDTDPPTAAGKAESVRLLLGAGADVTVVGEGGNTALHWAAFAGHTEMLDDLVTAGLDVDAANDLGRTALMVAASVGRDREVSRLFQLGADVDVTDVDGKTARDLAEANGHAGTVAILDEATDGT